MILSLQVRNFLKRKNGHPEDAMGIFGIYGAAKNLLTSSSLLAEDEA